MSACVGNKPNNYFTWFWIRFSTCRALWDLSISSALRSTLITFKLITLSFVYYPAFSCIPEILIDYLRVYCSRSSFLNTISLHFASDSDFLLMISTFSLTGLSRAYNWSSRKGWKKCLISLDLMLGISQMEPTNLFMFFVL